MKLPVTALLAAMIGASVIAPAQAYRGPPSQTSWLKNESSVRVRVQFMGQPWVELGAHDERRFAYQHGTPHMLVEYQRDGHWAYACVTTMDRSMATLTVRGGNGGVSCGISETTF